MTPVSTRLAPLSPRDQLVQPLALHLQLLDEALVRWFPRLLVRAVRPVLPMPHAHHHAVAAVVALPAPAAEPAAHHSDGHHRHAQHHQGAYEYHEHQQQDRDPYRPFHLSAPSLSLV